MILQAVYKQKKKKPIPENCPCSLCPCPCKKYVKNLSFFNIADDIQALFNSLMKRIVWNFHKQLFANFRCQYRYNVNDWLINSAQLVLFPTLNLIYSYLRIFCIFIFNLVKMYLFYIDSWLKLVDLIILIVDLYFFRSVPLYFYRCQL